MPLTDTAIKNLKPKERPYKKADARGLHIYVRPNGSKLWRMSYRFEGKHKLLSFGRYPDVSLSRAREKMRSAKSLLADGIDPSAKKKADKAEAAAINEHTFEKISAELLEKRRKEGLAESTLKKKQWLLSFAIMDFGKIPVRDVTPAILLKTLRGIEAKGNYETAKRVRTAVGEVLRYAVATARLEIDPTPSLRGALIAPVVTHMPALTDKVAFSRLVRAIWSYSDGAPATRAALKLMVLLYPRPGELRLSKWEEFDLEKRSWTIPAHRTKMRRAHTKPLSATAVQILEQLLIETGNKVLVCPSSISRTKPISENTLNQALRRMGFEKGEHTSHGFRASASSLLNESGLWNQDAIEAELSHAGSDQVRKAYHRAQYWDERVRMASWWESKILKSLEGSGHE
ncbi:MAG: integrase arm-type DNA-binding domain-containing protein [Pseudomonadota bacterium]